MRCPKCGGGDTGSSTPVCRTRRTPSSVVANAARADIASPRSSVARIRIEVMKSDGSSQAFDRNKLLVGLMRATSKRDIDLATLNGLIDDIERELRSRTLTAVTSHELGDMVLKRLEKIDKVAYIRFASVYRDFQNIEEFLSELDKLR